MYRLVVPHLTASLPVVALQLGAILPLDHEVTPLRLLLAGGLLLGIPLGIFGIA